MSVPLALEAILSLGHAYGLQLHTELTERLPHRAATNVGQIYSTLERLKRDGFIEQRGSTADGLPLYALTTTGLARTRLWMNGEMLTPSSDWVEYLDVIMMAASVPSASMQSLGEHIAQITALSNTDTVTQRSASRLYEAIRGTLEDATAARATGEIKQRGLKSERPQRGRRPRNSVQ